MVTSTKWNGMLTGRIILYLRLHHKTYNWVTMVHMFFLQLVFFLFKSWETKIP